MSWRKPAVKHQINLGVKWSHAVECRSDVGDEAFLVWHYRLVTGFEHGPPKHRLFIINDRESTAEHAGLFETFRRLNPLRHNNWR